MRYVSTRGEAPSLGFMEAMLAGLARDGGLYMPESWPQLAPTTIAGFAGRPYAEVAVEVIRPFVGEAITLADLARLASEAYGTFRTFAKRRPRSTSSTSCSTKITRRRRLSPPEPPQAAIWGRPQARSREAASTCEWGHP